MGELKKYDHVSFSWTDKHEATHSGTGKIVSDPDDGHALVAADPDEPGAPHGVIYCALTWLTFVSDVPA